jgi:hypothetical protein
LSVSELEGSSDGSDRFADVFTVWVTTCVGFATTGSAEAMPPMLAQRPNEASTEASVPIKSFFMVCHLLWL